MLPRETLVVVVVVADLFLQEMFAFLGRQVEEDALVSGTLCVDARQRDVRVVAVTHAVDVRTHHVTFLRQRVKQLLQPLQTYHRTASSSSSSSNDVSSMSTPP